MILHSSVEKKTKKRRKDKPSKYQTALFFGCCFFLNSQEIPNIKATKMNDIKVPHHRGFANTVL